MYYFVCYWVLVRKFFRKGASYREILTNKEEKTKEREREDMREKELGNVRKRERRENETKGLDITLFTNTIGTSNHSQN